MSADDQREAIAFLADNLFSGEPFAFPRGYLEKTEPNRWLHWGMGVSSGYREDYPYHARILAMKRPIVNVEAAWWSDDGETDRLGATEPNEGQGGLAIVVPPVYSSGASIHAPAASESVIPTYAPIVEPKSDPPENAVADETSGANEDPRTRPDHKLPVAPSVSASSAKTISQQSALPSAVTTTLTDQFDLAGEVDANTPLPKVRVKALMEDDRGQRSAILDIEGSGTHVCTESDVIALHDAAAGRYLEVRKITNKFVVLGISGHGRNFIVQ